MKVSFHPLVQRDFSSALRYYEDISFHLAEEFDREVQAAVQRIKDFPTRYPFYLSRRIYRRHKLKRFPYMILYRVKKTELRVTALKHEKQHPGFGMSRI